MVTNSTNSTNSKSSKSRRSTLMYVAFKLTVPQTGSWNSKWSGEGKLYAKVYRFHSPNYDFTLPEGIISSSPYYYDFGDSSWIACVTAEKVTAQESLRLRELTEGFFGYDWMIDSIISHGKIITPK